MLGGYQSMKISAAAELDKYLDVKVKGVKELKLIGYEKQVVNGYNHKIKYQDKSNKIRTIIVYESIEGELQITSDSTGSAS